MTLDPTLLARLDARRLARVLHEVGGHGAPLSTGWMAADLPGSWANYAANLADDVAITDADLDRLVAWYRDQGRQPRVVTHPYQHPSLVAGLACRGFAVDEEEVFLVRDLAEPVTDEPLPTGVTLRVLDPTDAADVDAYVRAQCDAFHPDGAPPGTLPILRRVATHPRCRFWSVWLDGELAGSAGLEWDDTLGVLISGGVAPFARRRGIQRALIRARLADARARGLAVAVVGSVRGGPTARNASRMGFAPGWQTREWHLPDAS
jgi:ribosomal protein S18 acetylase RimI-like enzyme